MSRPNPVVEELRKLRELFDIPTRVLVTQDAALDYEEVDPIPKEAPISAERPPTLDELVKVHVEGALSEHAQGEGYETWSEANDFEEEDPELLPLTEYQMTLAQEGLQETEIFETQPLPVESSERSEPTERSEVEGSEATETPAPSRVLPNEGNDV